MKKLKMVLTTAMIVFGLVATPIQYHSVHASSNSHTSYKITTKKYVHTVKKGETLYSISKKYKTTVDAVKKENKLKSNTIKKGQKLKITVQTRVEVPAPKPTPAPAPKPAPKPAPTPTPVPDTVKTYTLELSRWGVYKDGTHPTETTKGINDALKWAKENGYKALYVPAGTYLISKGAKEDDATARISMISDMILQLDKDAVFKKETNGFKGYSVIYFGPGVKNATMKGGTLIGDRDTHDFSTGGTQEWGHGVLFSGGDFNTVEGVKIQKMNGDGIYVGMSPVWGAWEAKYGGTPKSTIELGGVDENGNLTNEAGKIRNIGMLELREDTPEKYRMINVWIPQGMSSNRFDVFYYDKDKNFISKDSGIMNAVYSKAPKDTRYYRLVFSAPKLEGVYALMYHLDIASNVVIKNNDIGFNRRQGITANGENVQILNNYIHDTKGTSPEAGIDIEPGFATAYNHTIKGNTFENNVIQMVVSKGENLLVENNRFIKNKSNSGIVGLHVHPNYKNVQIKNNYFEGSGSGLSTEYPNSTVSDNTFVRANANVMGSFAKGNITDGTLQVSGYGVLSGNVTDTVIKSSGNHTQGGGIYIKGLVHVNNVQMTGTLTSPVTIDSNAASKDNTYQNLSVVNGITGSRGLPSGTFKNNVSFSYTGSGTIGLGVQFGEKVTLDGVAFKNVTVGLHSIVPDGELVIKNSILTYDGELNSSSIWGADGKNLTIQNNTIHAKNATNLNRPIISIGRENDEKYLHGALIDGNKIHTKAGVIAIDSIKARPDTPVYTVQNNLIYNGSLNLLSKDINKNNQLLKE